MTKFEPLCIQVSCPYSFRFKHLHLVQAGITNARLKEIRKVLERVYMKDLPSVGKAQAGTAMLSGKLLSMPITLANFYAALSR
jgi:hypothetical protein